MTRKERYNYILDYFRKNVGEVSTELMFGSAFQLLCATLLSAQCTDKRINAITPALFAKFPDAKAMAAAEGEDGFEFVRRVFYPNWPLPKRYSFFLCKITNITSRICTE